MVRYAFTVHTVRPQDVGAVEIVFLTEDDANEYARDRSSDFRVLATSVTRFTVGELGTRRPLSWFVNGTEQPHRDPRPGRTYPADGHPAHG